MAYIGKQPTTGDFVLLDNLTASATASYTMQRNSVNFEPQSANHMIVSLNGTIQKPGSSFTISGSTITFASALTSSDAIDFILVLGNVNDVGVATSVVDSAITKGKLDLISTSGSPGLTVKGDGSSENGTIQLNCSQNSHGVKISSPAHSAGQSYELILPTGNVTADKFLKVASVSGSGTTGIGQLSFADAGGGSLVHINTSSGTSNVSSVSLNDIFSSTYKTYKVFGTVLVDTDGIKLEMQYTKSSGSTVGTAGYKYLFHGENINSSSSISDASNGNSSDTGGVELAYAIDTDATYSPVQFEMTFYDPGQHFASYQYFTGIYTYYKNNGNFVQGTIGGQYRENFNATGLKFSLNASGNITRHYFNVYGIKNSGS